MGAVINGTPVKSIIAIVLSLIFTAMFAVAYAVIQKFHVFFTTGLLMGCIITIISIVQLYTFMKKVKSVNETLDASLNYTTCPEYWTTVRNKDVVTCSNNFKNLRFASSGIGADGVRTDNAQISFSLKDFNAKDENSKCSDYPDIAWVERVNKCSAYA